MRVISCGVAVRSDLIKAIVSSILPSTPQACVGLLSRQKRSRSGSKAINNKTKRRKLANENSWGSGLSRLRSV